MKLYLDDKRTPQTSLGWDIICRTAESAMQIVKTGVVTEISFDHDLGAGRSGYDVALLIEFLASKKLIPKMKWNVHSSNPPGANNIRLAMTSADLYWENP